MKTRETRMRKRMYMSEMNVDRQSRDEGYNLSFQQNPLSSVQMHGFGAVTLVILTKKTQKESPFHALIQEVTPRSKEGLVLLFGQSIRLPNQR
jgi:hypothetical protein